MPAQPNPRGFLTGPASASVNEHERWIKRGKTGVTPTTNDRCLAWMKARENWGHFLGDAKREPAWLYFVGADFIDNNAAEIDKVRSGPPKTNDGHAKEERLTWAAEHHARANKFSKRNTHVGDMVLTQEELMAATERNIADGVYQAHNLPQYSKASTIPVEAADKEKRAKQGISNISDKKARKLEPTLHVPKDLNQTVLDATTASIEGRAQQLLQLDPESVIEALTRIAKDQGQTPTQAQAQHGTVDVNPLQTEFEDMMDDAEAGIGDKMTE